MFLREAPTETLKDVRKALAEETETILVPHEDVDFNLTVDDPTIRFGEYEVPVSSDGIIAFGNYLDVPSKFLQRIQPDVQEFLLTELLHRISSASVAVTFTEGGIRMVREPHIKFIDPRTLVDALGRVIDPKAPVVEWFRTDSEFRCDVIVPEGFDRGIGGDKRKGDITRGGVRFGHDLKHNLAPWAQPYFYRLFCTNGQETFDPGLRVDARGQSVEEVLDEFEQKADEAFRRVEGDIKAYYDLRKEKIDNPERTLVRVAREAKLPDRTIMRVVEALPAYLEEDDAASMFTIANIVSNLANDPAIKNKTGARRRLEQVAGGIVTDHAERCARCQSKLVT